MAKTISVSDDSGINWYALPGNTGDFSSDAEEIEDTIFGEAYRSNEAGLITWTVSANAIFKGFAGYVAKVKQVDTTSGATMTGEATTQIGSSKTYQITDATRRLVDRNSSLTVKDNAVTVNLSSIDSFDYLHGKVTFAAGYTVTGPVTIDGTYFATINDLGKAQSFTLTQTADAIDTSDFGTVQGNNGYRTFNPGLRTVSLDLSGFYDITNGFLSTLLARSPVLIEINPDGSGGSIVRGYFRLITEGQSGDVGALEEESASFSLNVPVQTDVASGNPLVTIPLSWDHATTSTIPTAVKVILDAWVNETKPDVQYLWDGTSGVKGTAVVTDVSLEGSLEGMNTFSANFNGDGPVTTV